MNLNNSQQKPAIPVRTKGTEQIVYAIPAKPAPRPSFWAENWFGLLVIWWCAIMAMWIWVHP